MCRGIWRPGSIRSSDDFTPRLIDVQLDGAGPDAAFAVQDETPDWLFDFIMWVSVISCLGLLGAMVYFVSKYKATSRKDKPEHKSDS